MSFGRRLYYRDSYGRWRQDRRSQYRSSIPARFAVIALLVIAGIIVLASLLQSFSHGLSHGFHG
jgi:hypothetical protein